MIRTRCGSCGEIKVPVQEHKNENSTLQQFWNIFVSFLLYLWLSGNFLCSFEVVSVLSLNIMSLVVRFINFRSFLLCRVIAGRPELDGGRCVSAITFAVSRRFRSVGALYVHARALHRMVSLWAEVLQGQGGRRRGGSNSNELPMRHQDVSEMQPFLLLREREATVPLGRMTNNEHGRIAGQRKAQRSRNGGGGRNKNSTSDNNGGD